MSPPVIVRLFVAILLVAPLGGCVGQPTASSKSVTAKMAHGAAALPHLIDPGMVVGQDRALLNERVRAR